MALGLLVVEWMASWSSGFESVEWNVSGSTERCFLLEMSLGKVSWGDSNMDTGFYPGSGSLEEIICYAQYAILS